MNENLLRHGSTLYKEKPPPGGGTSSYYYYLLLHFTLHHVAEGQMTRG